MFDINKVKVGDYFETNEGYIGEIVYVSRIFPCNIYISVPECYQNEWCFTQEELVKAWKNGDFKQIGTYVFDDKDKTIEPLTPKAIYKDVKCKKTEIKAEDYPSDICINSIPYSYESILDHIEYDNMAMGNKINEIIKWINEKG